MPAPRTVLVKYPYGAGMGDAGEVEQQQTILKDMLQQGLAIQNPGEVVELPYRWRRHSFERLWPAL